MKVRKPLGKFWCGNLLQVDILLQGYGLRNMKELHSWLGKAIAWAEENKVSKRRKKKS